MSEERQYRRTQNEKNEKQEKDEGGWDEKWRRDPVDAAMWAFLLMWAGFVLLGANLKWFDDIGIEAWAFGFLGAGVIVLLFAGFRLMFPAYRRPLGGNLVFGAVLIGVGLISIFDWYIIVPLILIFCGVGLLLTGILRRRPPLE